MQFQSPCTIVISSATGCGKSFFLRKMLDQNLFETPPTRVIYCYGIYQDAFHNMTDVEFVHGLPASFDNFGSDGHTVICIDDLACEASKNKVVENLFTRISHHNNITPILLTQNLFYQGKHMRTIALNTHYTILLKNPRSSSQTRTLQSQTGLKNLVEAYNDATKEKFGYLIIDLHPRSSEEHRLRTHIFEGEYPIIYH